SASIQVDKLNIAGEKNIYINTLKIPQLRIKAEEIDRSKTSPFGFTSKLELQESIILNKLEIPGFITMKNAIQKLAATWTEKPETGIDLGLKTFHIASPSLAIRNRLLTSFQTDSDFIAAANRIHIDHLNPFKANLSGLSIRWVLGKILKMGIEAEIKYLSTARLDTKGELAVDLEAFFNKFLKKSYHNNRLTGDAKFQWRFAGTIPTTEELKKLKEGSKFDIKNDFNFLDKLYFSSILNDVGLDWTVTDERKIKIGRVSTRKPVKYRFDKISGIGRASGNLLIENIDTGPIEIFKLPLKGDPLSIHLSFSGKHRYLKTFSFSQVLDLLPFKIKETLNISLYGLDRISKEDLASPLPAFLEHIGGNASSTLSFQGGNSLNTLTGDLNIEGKVMAGSKVQLTPGQRIDIKSWIDTPKMNVDIGSNFAIKNLQADLNLNKRFYISDQETKNKTKTSSLSVDVLKKRPLPFGSELKDVTLQRRMNRLQKRFKPKHSISFKSARIGGQPNPILIDRSVMDLDLSEALPKVDFFQSDLLGGTVIGSVLILDENPGFLLQTQMSFSGLNAKNLLSLKRGENEDRSISGELFLSFPLTEQSRQLLQELNLSLKFSHIGS
ncbi:MAG: hypothetical protein ACE5DO_13360, partial [Desulfobacterales bacterium]